MRHLVTTIVVLSSAACSVPQKHAADGDAGVDATINVDATIDDTAPETTITLGPDEFSRVSSATFHFTSDDATATFECSINAETPVVCSSPYTRTLGDGAHSFAVRAFDTAGNGDDTPAEHLWSIDMTAPDTILMDRPPVADNSTMVRFTFDSLEENVTFDCSLDAATFAACTSGAMFGPVSDGAHSFSVRAVDRAGNVDASPAIHAWAVDTSTPDTQLLGGPSGATGSTTATFTFVSPDAGAGATYECSLNAAAYIACTSPRTLTGLTERVHTFAVRVRDSVGNFDPSPATRSWTVDLTAPNTTILTGPTGMQAQASASFTFSSNEMDVTYTCSLDGTAFSACTSPENLASLGQGAHTFAVRATDEAGQVDASPATSTWTVDTVAPDIAITGGPAANSSSGPRVTFTFTVSDGAVACSLDGAAFTTCTSPMTYSLPAGIHQFQVRSIDTAGNGMTLTRDWTVVCSAPDSAFAAALLHLDETGQTLDNAVAGGVGATRGATVAVEPEDPATLATGRFGAALTFVAVESDQVAWPVALAAMPKLTIELWARPEGAAAAADVLVSGDGRLAIRAVVESATVVRFQISTVSSGATPATFTVTSGPVTAGTWHHVVAILDEPSLKLYVDGVRADIAGVALGTPPALDAIRLGGSLLAAYSGALDEVWLAPTALASDEAVLGRYCPL